MAGTKAVIPVPDLRFTSRFGWIICARRFSESDRTNNGILFGKPTIRLTRRPRLARAALSLPLKEVAYLEAEVAAMWNWINCYLSGRHEFAVTCSSGSMFLQCNHCGKRSNGWAVHTGQRVLAAVTRPVSIPQPAATASPLPFAPRQAVRAQRSA